MRTYVQRALDERDERGFTLIELLVVIIIIGILAAIAIPVFLDQRRKGYDASAKADLRNLASFEEIYLNDFQTYGNANQLITDEPKMEVSLNDTMHIWFQGNKGYCLEADYAGAEHVWWYDSQDGGLEPAGSGSCVKTLVSASTPGGGLDHGGVVP
jgi:type IV pilus assembly protein PilA